jgi:hypothetical protein
MNINESHGVKIGFNPVLFDLLGINGSFVCV